MLDAKKSLLQKLIQVSKEVGDFIKAQQLSPNEIEEKSFNNLVSRVDKEAEQKFVSRLSQLLPDAGFIAEEGTGSPIDGGYNWIIDPLDGTTNFIHNIPFYCTSVALHGPDGLVLGVIYEPHLKECFSAIRGEGAWLNEKPIRVSSASELSKTLLATGFPYDDFGRQEAYMELLKDFTTNTRGIRRLGSAALDLAYVACGRCDAFYEYGLNPWDVAAGILIVEEAGGKVTGFQESDDPIFGADILSSNGQVHEQLVKKIAFHKV
jgi:myo-inositol-1(or 4)-monophosphatase